jgi:hypothetical protein
VGTGGSELCAQRVADSTTWTATQSLPVLTGDGWHDIDVRSFLPSAESRSQGVTLGGALRPGGSC